MENAFRRLSLYAGIGHYHALRLALDLNYCTYINLSTIEWIACVRGVKNGLNLIIPMIKGRDEDCNNGLLWLQQRQWDEWERLGYTPVGQEAKLTGTARIHQGRDGRLDRRLRTRLDSMRHGFEVARPS